MMVKEEIRTRTPDKLKNDEPIKKIIELELFPNQFEKLSQANIAWIKYKDIDELTGNIVEKFDRLLSDSVLDLQELCKELGGKVLVDEFFNFEEDITISRDNGTFVIKLPHSMNENPRARFTIAHELGHYFLHYVLPVLGGDSPFAYRFFRKDRSRFEKQADRFAASLTMPESSFKAKAEELIGDENKYEKLASWFGVSQLAAEIRSEVLRAFEN